MVVYDVFCIFYMDCGLTPLAVQVAGYFSLEVCFGSAVTLCGVMYFHAVVDPSKPSFAELTCKIDVKSTGI